MMLNGLVARIGLAVVLLAVPRHPSSARELDVGPGLAFGAPSAAAAVAADGDTVNIAPGTYYDCAEWRANRLTIRATGPGVRITDKACAGKAAFVIDGMDVTIRGLSFARIRVMDENGAGIRAEGRDLTVEDTRFIDNQIGILAGGSEGSLRISGCTFTANGDSWDGRPTHAVAAGALDLLRIENSTFQDARGGDHIVSGARRTELIGNHLSDAGGPMSGALVWVTAGSLVLDRNTVDLGVGAGDRPGAILVTGDVTAVSVSGNTLIEPHGDVPLVRNWAGVTATQTGNNVPADTETVSDSGALYHRLRSYLASLRTEAHGVAGVVRHRVAVLARKFKLIP